VDLGGKKDTTIILRDLGKAFPFASNELEEGLQRLLGEFNRVLTELAMAALAAGDAETLGALMTEAQVSGVDLAVAGRSTVSGPLGG
jgi:galactokinase